MDMRKAKERVAERKKMWETSKNIWPVDLDEQMWHGKFVETVVHAVTQEYCPNINPRSDEERHKKNLMLKRIKEKVRKPTKKGDDFLFVGVPCKRMREDGGSSQCDESGLDVKGFLAVLDRRYKGQFGRYIKEACLSAFVSK